MSDEQERQILCLLKEILDEVELMSSTSNWLVHRYRISKIVHELKTLDSMSIPDAA